MFSGAEGQIKAKGHHRHHSEKIILAKTYTSDTPNYIFYTVYIVVKGQEEAIQAMLEDRWAMRPDSEGVIGCRLAWLQEKGPHGEAKLSEIVYWYNKASAFAKKPARVPKRFAAKQRRNHGQVLWNGRTPLGLKTSLRVAPLQVTVCPPFWQQISKFFTIHALPALESLTFQKLAMARQVGAESLGEVLNSHVNLDMDVEWAAPKVVVPIDPSRADRAVAFLDLGLLGAKSAPKLDSDKKFDTSSLYEHIIVTLANAELLFLPSKDALQQLFAGNSSPPRLAVLSVAV